MFFQFTLFLCQYCRVFVMERFTLPYCTSPLQALLYIHCTHGLSPLLPSKFVWCLQSSLGSALSVCCILLFFQCSLPHHFRPAHLPLSFGCLRQRSDTMILSGIPSICSTAMKRSFDYNLNNDQFLERFFFSRVLSLLILEYFVS